MKKWTSREILDDPYFQKFVKERNLQKSTRQGYLSGLKHFLNCTQLSIQQLIEEVYEDEQKGIPTKQSRLKKYLDQYLVYLNENIPTSNTRHTYFTKLETFLRHFDVTVPNRPPMKIKQEYHIDYFDLPDKGMIEIAIGQSDDRIGALIYFMTSSGSAAAETLSVTIGMFLEGLRDYTKEEDPESAFKELRGRLDLVPLLSMTRRKTGVPYYTCCSSEATYHIIEYLCSHNYYDKEERLWPFQMSYILKIFQEINDNNKWGRKGPYRRFRSHMLRKFHASNIGCSFELINTLEGRTNGTIHEIYVKQKPAEIKQTYMEYMHNVMIHPERFEGPHCVGETINEMVQEQIKISQEQTNEKQIRQLQETVQTLAEQQGQQRPVQVIQPTQQPDMNMYQGIITDLQKQIAVLEYRIEQLENKKT